MKYKPAEFASGSLHFPGVTKYFYNLKPEFVTVTVRRPNN